MAYNGYITKITEIRKHPNADRLQIVDLFSTQCIVSNDYYAGQKIIFFPADGQLSEEFCKENDLVRRKDENGNLTGGYLDPVKRNIKTIKLRKEVSEGLILPIESLKNFCDISTLVEGQEINVLNGHEICRKYIPKTNNKNCNVVNNKNKKHKNNTKQSWSFVFPEHIDTPQLRFYINKIKPGELITITEKLEGTSGRSAYLPCHRFTRIFHRKKNTYKYFLGTRRVNFIQNEKISGYYDNNDFRKIIHDKIAPHLEKNMEVFYEIVGWTGENGSPIMGEVDTKCLGDKNFTKKYGEKMTFNYGLKPGNFDFYIYRIAILDDDGNVIIDFSTNQIKNWCEKNGFKMVPILYQGFLKDTNELEELANTYNDGESTLGSHWREGCVIRVENSFKFEVYKSKNNNYRIMKGMAVDNLDTTGLSQDILEEM